MIKPEDGAKRKEWRVFFQEAANVHGKYLNIYRVKASKPAPRSPMNPRRYPSVLEGVLVIFVGELKELMASVIVASNRRVFRCEILLNNGLSGKSFDFLWFNDRRSL